MLIRSTQKLLRDLFCWRISQICGPLRERKSRATWRPRKETKHTKKNEKNGTLKNDKETQRGTIPKKKRKKTKTKERGIPRYDTVKKKERRSAIPKRSINNNDGVFFHVRVSVTDDRVVWHAKIPDRASTSTARWWCLEKTTSGVVLGRIVVVVVVVMEKRKNAFFVLVVVCVVLVNATMDEKKFCGCEQQL